MPRGDQVGRQWCILRLLETHPQGLKAKELHGKLDDGSSERTIFRDLQQLAEYGFPLYEEDGRWRILGGGKTIPVTITEAIAYGLCDELLAPMNDTETGAALATLRRKLSAVLGEERLALFASLRATRKAGFSAPAKYGAHAVEIRAIESALAESKAVRVVYTRPGGEDEVRELEPLVLQFLDGRLYLAAWCRLRSDYRTFAIGRLKGISILDEAIAPRDPAKVAQYVGRDFGGWRGDVHWVEVDLTRPVANLALERKYCEEQSVVPLPEGGVRLRMEVSGLPRVASWVASFGGLVIPRSPPELVAMVRALFEEGLAALNADPG